MTKEQKELLAVNLVTKRTVKEAAEASGVTLSTVYRVKRTEVFQKLLNETKSMLFSEAMQKAQGLVLDSLNTLDEIRADPSCNDSARVASAKAIIELGKEMFDREMILKRLQEMEERLAENEKEGY